MHYPTLSHFSLDLRVHIRAADDRRFLCCHEQAGIALLPEEELSQSGLENKLSYPDLFLRRRFLRLLEL
jgi:hypothetical protein